MRTFSALAVFGLVALSSSSALAGQRFFHATLTKVAACNMTEAQGSALLTIDDASGAVTGTITISGITAGATISSAGIHNKNAGDNLVGAFDGIDASAPNGTFEVTTTLNEIALPKILAGDGAVIVKSALPDSGCGPGAIRGDMLEVNADDAGPGDGGTTGPAVDAAASPTGDSGTASDAGATSGAAGDDGGCGVAGSGASGLAGIVLAGLVAAFARRRRAR